jgi:hypothetical protein
MNLIPATVLQKLGDSIPTDQLTPDPWLPFAWPLQVSAWGACYGETAAAEVDWARGILQVRLSHPPVPRAYPRNFAQSNLEQSNRDLNTFCWALNRVVHAVRLDHDLQAVGYDPVASQLSDLDHLLQLAPQMPEYAQVLLILELLYRQIALPQQTQIKAVCGEDAMRAAHQMNMLCIDPKDDDRTLLQVQRIGLKLCGSAEATIRSGMQVQLSDGRIL